MLSDMMKYILKKEREISIGSEGVNRCFAGAKA